MTDSIIIPENTKAIPLSNCPERFALVDDEDYPLLSRHTWTVGGQAHKPYIMTNFQMLNGKRCVIYLHKLIMGGFSICDHISGDQFDNRKANLRRASMQQNGWNTGKHSTMRGKPCSSKYKGVRFSPLKGKSRWEALFKYVEPGKHKSTGKMIRLGYFWDEDDAARAYNKKIRELRGEFAWLNPVPDQSSNKSEDEK